MYSKTDLNPAVDRVDIDLDYVTESILPSHGTLKQKKTDLNPAVGRVEIDLNHVSESKLPSHGTLKQNKLTLILRLAVLILI